MARMFAAARSCSADATATSGDERARPSFVEVPRARRELTEDTGTGLSSLPVEDITRAEREAESPQRVPRTIGQA